jgi:hypothetical protein
MARKKVEAEVEVIDPEIVGEYKVTAPFKGYNSILVNGVEVKIRKETTIIATKEFAEKLRKRGIIE